MKYSFLILTSLMTAVTTVEPIMIFNFSNSDNLNDWYIMDDVVMGGRSDGHFSINNQNKGEFSGTVSLENYGGFSSVRYGVSTQKVDGHQKCIFRIKGDGKRYQLRLKSSKRDRHSYIQYFDTSGEWETITLELNEFHPSFRGRQLSIPNFPGDELEEISFLIANKKAETFKLELDWMELR